MFKGTNLTPNSEVHQNTQMFGSHERPLIDASSSSTYTSRYRNEMKQR